MGKPSASTIYEESQPTALMADDYPCNTAGNFMTISGGGIVGAVAAGESTNVTDRRAIWQRAPEMPPPPLRSRG
jgi:hypothetical protein